MKKQTKFSLGARDKILKNAGYNTALIPSRSVKIDLLTDSLMHFVLPKRSALGKRAVESASANLGGTFKKCFGYKHTLPIAQGRMAETILAKIMVRNAMVVPSNMLFITTRIHQEFNGASTLEIPIAEAYDLKSDCPFKGDMDIKRLRHIISEHKADWIPYIYVETCVNASGGHPVSMANIKEVSRMAKNNKIPLILDACRILENAYLIKERENGFGHKSVKEIVWEFCSHTDGCTMSITKDFFIETGGFIAMNNEELYYKAQDLIMAFGDGLSVEAKAALNNVLNKTFANEKQIHSRAKKARYLWNKLKSFGLPVVNPPGGHAVFLDVKELCETLSDEYCPKKAFLAHLYQSSGVRAGENILTPYQEKQGCKMLRLAIPVQMYSLSDMNYVARSLKSAWEARKKIKGLKKVYQPPSLTGSFFAEYKPVGQ